MVLHVIESRIEGRTDDLGSDLKITPSPVNNPLFHAVVSRRLEIRVKLIGEQRPTVLKSPEVSHAKDTDRSMILARALTFATRPKFVSRDERATRSALGLTRVGARDPELWTVVERSEERLIWDFGLLQPFSKPPRCSTVDGEVNVRPRRYYVRRTFGDGDIDA